MHNAYHHGVQRRGQRVLKGGAWDASRQTLNIFGGRSPEKWGAAPPPSEQTEWGGGLKLLDPMLFLQFHGLILLLSVMMPELLTNFSMRQN